MKTLKKQINLGGNIAIFLIPSNLIQSIQSETILYVGTDPTHKIECAAETIQHTCKIITTRAGDLYEHTITAFLPGYNYANQTMLTKLRQHTTLIAILQNGEGNYYHIGNSREGLRLTFDFDSAKDPSNRNGFTLELTGHLPTPLKPIQFPPTPL
jgi:hypothetical protein